MKNLPNYSYKVAKGVLVIYDEFDEHNPSLSVTNGAEYVIEAIFNELGYMPHTIIYRDTEGYWGRLLATSDGEFHGFAGLGEEVVDEGTAIQRVANV